MDSENPGAAARVQRSREPEPRLLFLALAASAGAILAFAWLAALVVRGGAIPYDLYVRGWVHAHSSPALTALLRAVSFLGEPGPLISLSVAAFMTLLHLARWRRAALLFVIVMTGAFVLDNGLKALFHRARPETFFGTPTPNSFSFPSGHALYSVCFWGVLAVLAGLRARRPLARRAVWAGGAAMAALIGYSRIYLGVHYPSDVAAGYAAAIVWVTAVALADRRLRRRA